MHLGIPEWDEDVNYRQHAFSQVAGRPYVALVATGPEAGNPTDPTAVGQTVWRLY